MGTSAGISLTTPPECSYAPRMTRAAALALRASGGLRERCDVVITDGPVIGTAGNTSITEIELNPVSATEFGMSARVHTTFSANAWAGIYDIDKGVAGTIGSLTDDWGNTAQDEDTDAPTVHTQVPWHRGSATFRGNTFDDADLPGWAAALATCTMNDNEVRESSVDLTGKTSGTFTSNVLRNATFTATHPTSFLVGNMISFSTVNCVGTGSLSVQNNTIRSGSLSVDGASSSLVTFNNNTVGGVAGAYRVVVQGKTGGFTTVSGCHLNNSGLAAQEMLCSGSGSIQVTTCEIEDGNISLDGSGATNIAGCTFQGNVITKAAGSPAPLTITTSQISNVSIAVAATNAAVANVVDQATMRGGVLDLRGPVAGGGRNDFITSTIFDIILTVAATATAGVTINNGSYDKGVVNQNRTAGTGSLVLNDCATLGVASTFNDNGTVDPGQPNYLNRVSLKDSTLTVGSLTAARSTPDVVTDVDMSASILTVTGLAGTRSIRKGRMLDGNLTNAGFDLGTFTLDGLTKTLTADQTGRAGSVAFDNYL